MKKNSKKVLEALKKSCERKVGSYNGSFCYGEAPWISLEGFSKKEREIYGTEIKRNRYGFCDYCNSFTVDLEREHYKPKARGGSDNQKNLAYACRKCNELKADKHPHIFFYGWFQDPELAADPHMTQVQKQQDRLHSNREYTDESGNLMWKSEVIHGFEKLTKEERENAARKVIQHFQAGKTTGWYPIYDPVTGALRDSVEDIAPFGEIRAHVESLKDYVGESMCKKIEAYQRDENIRPEKQRKARGKKIAGLLEEWLIEEGHLQEVG